MPRLTTLTLFALFILVSAPVQATYRDTVLATPGLVSYWELNEIAGTSAADSKGQAEGSTDRPFARQYMQISNSVITLIVAAKVAARKSVMMVRDK